MCLQTSEINTCTYVLHKLIACSMIFARARMQTIRPYEHVCVNSQIMFINRTASVHERYKYTYNMPAKDSLLTGAVYVRTYVCKVCMCNPQSCMCIILSMYSNWYRYSLRTYVCGLENVQIDRALNLLTLLSPPLYVWCGTVYPSVHYLHATLLGHVYLYNFTVKKLCIFPIAFVLYCMYCIGLCISSTLCTVLTVFINV